MDNLRDFLEQKYFGKIKGEYALGQIAKDVLYFLNANPQNYFDITGFAKDFYLATFLSPKEKQIFYKELQSRDFFSQLNTFLYADDFSICSWTIYIIGKFSGDDNAIFLEQAYEANFSLTNPMLSYRCLNELCWLNSKKLDHYLSALELNSNKSSKLTLLYYWEAIGNNSKFNQLLTNKEFLNFLAPNQALANVEEGICNRLLGFENHISKIYNSSKNIINRNEFENIAENYFINHKNADN